MYFGLLWQSGFGGDTRIQCCQFGQPFAVSLHKTSHIDRQADLGRPVTLRAVDHPPDKKRKARLRRHGCAVRAAA